MENFEFECDLNEVGLTRLDVANLLPNCKTKVLEVSRREDSNLYLKFLIPATCIEEIHAWQSAYEEISVSEYSVESSRKCSGRYIVFKRRMHCRHNTKCPRVQEPNTKNRTRNTNCPSVIVFTLRAIKSRYQGKNPKHAPNAEMPCVVELVATHNHPLDTPEALRHREVSEEVKQKLIKLYKAGHTAATALKAIKEEICSTCENFEDVLADRKYCPDYSYCYYIYRQTLKEITEPLQSEGDVIAECSDNFDVDAEENNSVITEDIQCCTTPEVKFEVVIQDDSASTSDFNYDEVSNDCLETFNDISTHLRKFVDKSPQEVIYALKVMRQRILKLKTSSAIALACANFGLVRRRRKMMTQQVVIGRRKAGSAAKRCNVGGRSRNHLVSFMR